MATCDALQILSFADGVQALDRVRAFGFCLAARVRVLTPDLAWAVGDVGPERNESGQQLTGAHPVSCRPRVLDASVKGVINVILAMGRRVNTDSGPSRFLTTREAAERLGVTVNSIKAWIREERLPALRTPGGHHRIREADLLEFQSRLTAVLRAPGTSRPRILVVDDDDALLAALRDTLQEVIPDSVVQTADDGYEGLVQVGAFRPDVLVIDIRMPRLDGFEVCRRLKHRKETAAIRILAVTAHPEGEVRARVLECGADDLLEKPFTIERFRSRVVALLERAGQR